MTPLLSKFSVSFSLALYPLRCKSLEKLIFLFFHSNLDKPLFLQPADYTVDVVEGQPAIVNMTAKANPSEVTYAWSREGSAIKAVGDAGVYDRITFNGALLNLTMVRRDDKGEYKCDATNNEGTQSGIVRLNVQCKRTIQFYHFSCKKKTNFDCSFFSDPATILQTRSVVMVNEGSDAYLECQATGNPLTTTTVSWRREGFDLDGRTVQSSGIGVAYLSVKQVNRNDTGAFECVADNGIGGQSTEKTWLLVKCEFYFQIPYYSSSSTQCLRLSPPAYYAAFRIHQHSKLMKMVCRLFVLFFSFRQTGDGRLSPADESSRR